MKTIDALGKACPIPVIMAKNEIEANRAALTVVVDNETAVKNLKKMAGYQNYSFSVTGEGERFEVVLTPAGEAPEMELTESFINKLHDKSLEDWCIFVGSQTIGTGDDELGKNLMRMFFYTLTEEKQLPQHILFMNGGVKLPTLDDDIAAHLKTLIDRGVSVLVCGACLNYYGLTDALQAGEVSNMYDIAGVMFRADKVINL